MPRCVSVRGRGRGESISGGLFLGNGRQLKQKEANQRVLRSLIRLSIGHVVCSTTPAATSPAGGAPAAETSTAS